MRKTMKPTLAVVCSALALLASTPVLAEEVTITGVGACAKCLLKQAADCQNTVTVSEEGKDIVYYLVPNDASAKFAGQLCKERYKVTVTGTVKEVEGKLKLTPTSVALADN